MSVLPYGVSDRVALHTLSLTLAVLRRVVDGHQAVHEGLNPEGLPETEQVGPTPTVNWVRWPDVDTLNDKTVGIIGFGEIGACFARMLPPFNCRVLYHKRTRLSPEHEAYYGIEYAGLDEALSQSDIVVSFVPYSEDSRKMLGAREFGLMRPSAIFINTGRANTVDEAAMVDALRTKRIRGGRAGRVPGGAAAAEQPAADAGQRGADATHGGRRLGLAEHVRAPRGERAAHRGGGAGDVSNGGGRPGAVWVEGLRLEARSLTGG